MSDIAGELAWVREAFDKPTLRLLDRKWAPFVLAVFKSSFSRDRRSVPCELLHTQVDAYLADLRSTGIDAPEKTGRALCVQWMNDLWLYREIRDAGDGNEEHYSLTSHALEALLLVDGLARDRALISESRLSTIVDTVRHRATEANPDREERVRRLNQQISELTSERDRLAGGGDIEPASNEQMHEGYANLTDLIQQLPSDFKRVEESVAAMHRQIINDFRGEERPISEVLDDYLAKTDALMSSTAEGRAFEGAFTLLRNDALMQGLKADLETILLHPFALELSLNERRSFMSTVTLLRKGIDDVLTQRKGLTTTLREHIVNHDVVKDRELERVLRDVNRELATWMQTARPRSTVTAELMPGTLEVEHLRERFYDPVAHTGPPALADVSGAAPAAPSLGDLRQQGGPLLEELRDALVAAFGAGEAASVGVAFNGFDASLRRPVEILGLLQLAAQLSTPIGPIGLESFTTVRPDGSVRLFDVPRRILTDDDTAALAAQDLGSQHD
ncbi:MAG: DUF3375 domain-containing protein [Cryobacterium sp.]|uniref:DUF3375 domain-containing protein n=1 Tax=unclassified Cryobacterium TaxID=2649013 RepID=UPI0018CB613F|nr:MULTISPECIES: DUF3375 domain-containing protein [unclassified Cryobacterium]MCY7404145.1 DUF3375 domain-containing protein [Cryobacterium sp.]MEC5154350.1 hypothetical protein [Cryobacterium sp. CAN_C3]